MSSLSVLPSIISLLGCWLLLFCVVQSSELPWIRLTHDNFSSEIDTHPFLLCLATVPWCGESRSLMRELSMSLSLDESLHSLIQLRVVYINLDKGLKKIFSERVRYPTFTFFWHSTPLKYNGKLRLQNILTAIHRAIRLNLWDLPLKKLETAADLESFIGSTEKAVILFDFCNYTNKIRKSKHHQVVDKAIIMSPGSNNVGQEKSDRFVKNSTMNAMPEVLEGLTQLISNVGEDQTESSLKQSDVQEHAEASSELISRNSERLHGMLLGDITEDNDEFSNDGLSRNPVGNGNDVHHQVVSCEFENDLTSLSGPSVLLGAKSSEEGRYKKNWFTDSTKSGVFIPVEGCNRTEYSHFAKVYQSLIKIASAYTLTPELANFAIIGNKTLLSTWGFDRFQNQTWFLVQWMSDWPNLPRLYYGSEALESYLFGQKQLVSEVSRESINVPSSLCNDTMLVILFIDKVSPLPEVRRKSWEALAALRAFAREYVRQESPEMQVNTSMDFQRESKPASEPNLEKSGTGKQIFKDRFISPKSVSGQNLVLQATNQPIRVSKKPSSKNFNLLLHETAFDGNVVLRVLLEGNEKLKVDASVLNEDLQELELSKLLLSEDNAVYKIQEEKIVGEIDADSISSMPEGLTSVLSSRVGRSFVGLKAAKSGDRGKEEGLSPTKHESTFSFYFADGEDQWKDMVEPALPYPALVILDCVRGGQFIFPTHNQSIDFTSLKVFFDQFATKKLLKTYLSEVAQTKPRKRVQPPFVNRDFHEVDGVPRLTAQRLLQLLAQGSMVSLTFCTKHRPQFWERAALVLFTTPSCGFCKRMELVFREVHKLLIQHLHRSARDVLLEDGYCTYDGDFQNMDTIGGNLLATNELGIEGKVPRLFQIDCTLNDCSGFFESIDQEELYPSVILYPAQSKNHPIVFGGQSTVQEILKFIAIEGEAGAIIFSLLQGGTQKKGSHTKTHTQTGECHLPQTSQSILIDSRSSSSRHAYQFTADTTESPSSLFELDDDKHQTAIRPIVYPTVGSVLVATEQLSKASKAFESSKILIVKADGQEGFQGLIFNKPLAWNRLTGLDMEMEPLVNRTVLCYGGPVILQGEPFLSLSRLKGTDGFTEVVPGVYVGGPGVTMHVFLSIKEGGLQAADFWFFVGHAVWGWQQLLNEIEQQWWNLTSYEEGTIQLPIREWLEGSTISVADLLNRTL
ncbi:hypothetical protein GOP47_0013292 [Adiantum capillus-veneris]|uniref:Thioredoxin domain-containing protein n=1 Tax=Adiantum capillus-veneris TaxID=13818 RepID=A0A9D4UNY5_ADICA|nr:hypothetical protein GOP47_0013292 [Adiantum capillus-veneris]